MSRIILVSLFLTMAACGKTGDLYLPDDAASSGDAVVVS